MGYFVSSVNRLVKNLPITPIANAVYANQLVWFAMADAVIVVDTANNASPIFLHFFGVGA